MTIDSRSKNIKKKWKNDQAKRSEPTKPMTRDMIPDN
jgi:hypothetical protein